MINDNEYVVSADNEDDATDNALELAALDLIVTAIRDLINSAQ